MRQAVSARGKACGAGWLALLIVGLSPGVLSATLEPPGTPESWLAQVEHQITEGEYAVTWQSETALEDLAAAYHAPNRAQGLRTYFTPDGIRVVPRSPEAEGWEWSLTLVGVGRDGAFDPLAPAVLRAEGNRIEYDRGGLVEWYVNDAKGLEQGFTLEAPPSVPEGLDRAAAPVFVELALGGTLSAFPSPDGQAIDFRMPDGVNVLRYASLHVFDSRGTELPARMEALVGASGRRVRLVFDDADAVYPVTVDPLATGPAWTVDGGQTAAELGVSVSTAGDVNGDGYSDVIVGAYSYDNGHTNEGVAFVYPGSAAGVLPDPVWTSDGNQTNARYAVSVSTAGDVNGDGYDDVIVGAFGYDNGQTDEGLARVYLGSASGLASTAVWTRESNQVSAQYGVAVSTAGDVNGDGYDDIVVGAYLYDNGQTDEGQAFVYHGSPAGPLVTTSFIAQGNDTGAQFGVALGTAGDVNGDGYDDLIVGELRWGASDEGAAVLYLGSGSGLSGGTLIAGSVANALFGGSVATAGDVNGDGYADVIIGAYQHTNGQTQEGKALVYQGSAGGVVTVTPLWSFEPNTSNSLFGVSVATAGDVNGDGFADIVVGAFGLDGPAGLTDMGRAYMFLGSPTGPSIGANWQVDGGQVGALYGHSVATAGDVNGDGYSDVIVGASSYTASLTDEGRAFVYLGSASGPVAVAGWSSNGGQANASYGTSVSTAGDVNGDGYSDVVVGASSYDNGQSDEGRAFLYLGAASGLATVPAWTAESDQAGAAYGEAVGTAGDVNGDGYSDVLVGAWGYDHDQNFDGRAFLYYGSATGLQPTAAWTADGEQVSAMLGGAVAGAGDVNGDGYADFLIGAQGHDDGVQLDRGRVYVHYGSSTGPAGGVILDGDESGELFGRELAGAGDVNGDGYSDVIVGALHALSDRGQAHVYHGSVGGVTVVPAWTENGEQLGELFGVDVSTAGDVNADGYADVIVGAHLFNDAFTDEGRARVYLGSASGLAAAPVWFADGNQANSEFSLSVATAGDVNGDGYSDVVVGQPEYTSGQSSEGRALVYLGSATGPASLPAMSVESNTIFHRLGKAVATAGDVNGDGYADVIVGGPDFSAEARLYYGNGRDGLDSAPRQAREDGSAPIDVLGASDSDAFRLRALGRSPAGRQQVRLEWEIEPLGTAFDGTGTEQGIASDSGAPLPGSGSTVELDELVSDVTTAGAYHWRLRILRDSPFFPRSPWLALPYNNPTETDLRLGCIDLDGDGYGSPANTTCPAGAELDCDNTQATALPGGTEVCDGLDNDCNGEVDDLAAPAGIPLLTLARSEAGATLTWTGVEGATGYDIVRGDLGTLRSTGGDFTAAIDQCLDDDRMETTIESAGAPASGQAQFFLVRPINCGGDGTYDEDGPSQLGTRDPEIEASALACD